MHQSNDDSTTFIKILCVDPYNDLRDSNNNTTKQHDHKKDISDDDSSDDEERDIETLGNVYQLLHSKKFARLTSP